MNPHKRPIPSDFAIVAPTLPIYKLQKHYRASARVILRWLRMSGAPRSTFVPHNKRPAPDDLAKHAADMHVAALAKHYCAKDETVQRWLAESGLEAAVYVRPRKEQPTKERARSEGRVLQLRAMNRLNLVTVRAWDAADEAADKLRRFSPVTRCDEQGRFDIAGKFWRVGRVVLTDAELIERAERRAA